MNHDRSQSGTISIRQEELKDEPQTSAYIYHDPTGTIQAQPENPRLHTENSILAAQIESLNLYSEEEKASAQKYRIDNLKRFEMQQVCVERVLQLDDVVRFIVGGKGDKEETKGRATKGPEDENAGRECLDLEYVPRSSKEKEVMIRKFASKFVAMTKSAETAKRLAKLYLSELEMLSAYYESMYALRSQGWVFRHFEGVAGLFAAKPGFDMSHTFALQVTPLALPKVPRSRQDILLFAPSMSRRTQCGCAEELNKLAALGVKISIESGYAKTKLTGYYVQRVNLHPEAPSDPQYVNDRAEALKMLRMYELYKKCLLESGKTTTGILKSIDSVNHFSFIARAQGLYTIKVTMRLITGKRKREKYVSKSASTASFKPFLDLYLIMMMKYLCVRTPSAELIDAFAAAIAKAVFRQELESAIARLNNQQSSQLIKFRYRVSQKDWSTPLMATILVQSLFYLRSQSVPQAPGPSQVINYFVPKLPALIIRMDGLRAEYVKGQQDETSNPVLKNWRPLESMSAIAAELKTIQNELYAKFE